MPLRQQDDLKSQCPVCVGMGQITGPRSFAFRADPDDPFNRVKRSCEECEGTGVVSPIRRAALLAEAQQRVQQALNNVMGLPGDPR